ncbi:unnamed protein product, partial [Adineta steineri]
MVIEIRLVFKLRSRYFHQFWSLIQLGIIGCSLGSIGVYFWRFQEANRISQLFEQTNGYIYINLQLAVYVNDILTFLLGYCCFFSMIKFVQLFRFNQRVFLFAETLKCCAKAVISFSMMFAIVFMAFLSLFYLLFVSKLSSCSSLLTTAQMLFEMTLTKLDASQIMRADAFLGPFCFALFMFLVVFVCLSLKKLNQLEIQEERDCRMRSQYFDPIENFPDRMDQLLEALNRVLTSNICQGADQYARCSKNTACGCFHRLNTNDISICGFLWPTCSQLVPCNPSTNVCGRSDTICVRHPRCHDLPLCYPVSMIDQSVCPPITTLISLDTIDGVVYGVHNTKINQDSQASGPGLLSGHYPTDHSPANACDGATSTKYLHFGWCQSDHWEVYCGLDTGFYLELKRGASFVTGLQICPANDRESRDPLTVSLEG